MTSLSTLFLLLSVLVSLVLASENNKTFYCEQFFQDIRNRTGFEFTVNDNSPTGTVITEFEPPLSDEDSVYMTSDDAQFINFKDHALVVQKSLRPKNGETLYLAGTCVGLFEDYNFTAQFHFTYLVNVVDVNDAPVFINLPATVEVYENLTLGSIVYTVHMDDSHDLNPRFHTNYIHIEKVTGLETSRPSPTRSFLMTDTGDIRLLERLDYELGPRIYKMIIGASDGGDPPGRNQSRLVIRVLDVDDLPPRFTAPNYGATVIGEKPLLGKEECFNSTPRMLANDLDRDVKSDIRYDIIEGEPGTRDYWGEYFRVEPTTGMICQRQMVQRLLHDATTGRNVFFNFTFTVRAYQVDNPHKYDVTELFVEVIDDNQYAPVFARKLYRTSLPEYPVTNDGTTVVQVKATDKDFGLNSEFGYSLVNNPGGAFMVDSRTGDVRVAHSYFLDREITEYLELRVEAKEIHTIDQNSDVTRVLVHVLDVNDNSPVFTNATYRYTIKDTLAQGRPIHQFGERPHAFDSDAGDNGRVEYRIERVSRLGQTTSYTPMADIGRFTIDPDSGLISLSGSLRDLRRKRTYPIYLLQITARDRAPRQSDRLSSVADVYVTIRHANDHVPTFTPDQSGTGIASQQQPGRYHVTENAPIGTVITRLKATDDDGDEDVFLQYWIVEGDDLGQLDVTNDGRLVLKQPLDREVTSFLKLTVAVSDGKHNVTTTVGVFVDDKNDNAPRFELDEYSFTIPEDSSAGTVVGQTVATDADLADAGEITYSIKPGAATEVFAIRKGGIIVIEREGAILDREQGSSVLMKVIATDKGSPPLKTTVDVTVHLDDINDNVPTFTHPIYFGSVDEGGFGSDGQKITMETVINATDADATSDNRDIIYSLLGEGSDVLHIDPREAHITVTNQGQLDAETKQEYHLEVIATDRNNTGMSAHAELILTVKDINDNAPYFHGNTMFVTENDASIGQVVGHVLATDVDVTEENNRLIYVLRGGGYGKFDVDFETGTIAVADLLDREPYRKKYQLRIDALDSGLPRRTNTTTAIISVPTNRKPIIDKSSTSMVVAEDAPVGTVIGKVDAHDPDDDEDTQSRLSYIRDLDDTAPFRVREDTGHVFTTSSLDYETQNEFKFTIYVTDDGMSPMTSNDTVTVKISDVNDRPPMFQLSLYEGQVLEDDTNPQPAQLVVFPVNITTIDRDGLSSTRRPDLSLHGLHSDYFYIDTDDDVIRVSSRGAGLMDRESIDKFNFVLRATDRDNPDLYSEVDCVIYISDVNDNGPIYVTQPHELLVHDNVQVGDVIGRILADDADATSPNNEIMYILESDPFGKFRLDINTGSITVLAGLFFQPRQLTYDLVITAIDLGLPRRKAQTKVTVRVLKKDFRDVRPELLGDNIFHTVEEVPVGTVVGTLRFYDDDLAPSDFIKLQITSDTTVPFAINSKTGDVISTSRLDSDLGPRVYTFGVMATDTKNPQNEAKTTVGVIIQDINDNPPRFTQYEYRHRVADTFPADTIVATPFAYDVIDVEQSSYTYSLKGNDVGRYLTIDPKSGIVKTTSELEKVDTDALEYAIVAQDIHEASLSTIARLVVDVTLTGEPGPCVPETDANPASSDVNPKLLDVDITSSDVEPVSSDLDPASLNVDPTSWDLLT